MTPTQAAVTALAWRLRAWQVPDPDAYARAFVNDLLAQGWAPPPGDGAHAPRRQPEDVAHRGAAECRAALLDVRAGSTDTRER